jgi:2'-5' RNA ligase
LLERALVGIKDFTIQLKGISATPSCILLQGFPQDNNLEKIRSKLRHIFQASSLEHSVDKRYSIQTAHSTVIRFKKELNNSSRFLEFLNKYRNWNFGSSNIKQLELVYNDWYHKSSFVEVLFTFKIE